MQKLEIQNNQLIEKINEYENIIIAKHISPDWDAQGSALGLKEIIIDNFKNKKVYIVGQKLNELINFEDETLLTQDIIKQSLLVTVDVANWERVDFEFKDLVKEVFKIDHHIKVDDYASYELVDETSVACTQVVTIWAVANNLKISQEAAKNLYYGLITDSGRFLFDKTNEQTFFTASKLIETGIKINQIYDDLYLKSFELAKWQSQCFLDAKYNNNHSIGYICVKSNIFINSKLNEEEIKSGLSTLAGIKEIKIWFMAYQCEENGPIKVSIRSRDYDINKIAKMYNGGGHKLASGVKLQDWEQLEQLVKDLETLL